MAKAQAAATATKLKSFSEIGVFNGAKKPTTAMAASVKTTDGARAWLAAQIKRGQTEVFSIQQVLTEPLARELLTDERNPDNRPIRKMTVTEYKNQMEKGKFDSLNGDAIHISKEGLLNNGQHRLEASILAGKDLTFLFTFGLAREGRRTTDQGRNRTAKDFLSMDGYQEGQTVASVGLMLYQWRSKKRISQHSDDRLGISEIAEYAEKHYDQIFQSVRIIPRAGTQLTGGLPVLAFCHLICAEKDLVAANDFFTRLVNGNDLPRESAILTLSLKLRRRERLKRGERIELIIRAWNAHRSGRAMAQIPILNVIPEPA